ncbi:MAG TPA: CoA transferase [Pseudonocardia sp.]
MDDSEDETCGPLTGVRVLDLTSVVMGPMATQILADLGADVIAVEPRGGDVSRSMDTGAHPELSGVALNLLRNKRNISIDYKSDSGREAVLRIAATCDLVVTNHRPGVARRARLGYKDFTEARPDIIYCRAIGFPVGSGSEDLPAYDDIIQAASGVADASRMATGVPNLAPTLLADKVVGLSIVYAVTAALFARERTGAGTSIDVPMVDVTRSFMLVEHAGAATTSTVSGSPGYERILTRERRPQATLDGTVFVLPYSKQNYDDIFAWGNRRDLLDDPRFADRRNRIAHSEFLYHEVRAILAERTTEECLEYCRAHDIPATAAETLGELVERLPKETHPVVGEYRSIPAPVQFGRKSLPVRRQAPVIGQHTTEILGEVGYSGPQIADLLACSVAYQSRGGKQAEPDAAHG